MDNEIDGIHVSKLGIPVRYVPLVDYSNSRGAVDMGLMPELLPGFVPSGQPGMTMAEMLAAEMDILWVVGANPLKSGAPAGKKSFVVVQDMFLTETARTADVILPAASAYEKNGTVTNVCGEVQRVRKAAQTMGAKPDLEIIGLIAKEMGAARRDGALGGRSRLRRDSPERPRLRCVFADDRRGWCGANHACERPSSRREPPGPDPLGTR